MLIKIAQPPFHSLSSSFIIIDNIDRVEYSTNDTDHTDAQQLRMKLNLAEDADNHEIIVNDSAILDLPEDVEISYRLNEIVYQKNNHTYVVIFDTRAYICNDKGETLDKCFAGGIVVPA